MACANFKETAVGHFYDNMTARYNGYFNAKEMVLAVIEANKENHKDEFNKVLDVLRIGEPAKARNNASTMDESIEKCKRVIQRHKGSDWVDDSYFLIAKSYFLKGDYYAALDLFRFVSAEYPETEVSREAQLWVSMCYIQMEKFESAQAFIANALDNKAMEGDMRTEAELINAHILIKMRNYQDAIRYLEKAIPNVSKRKEKNRYIFILAQLYQATGKTAKAREQYSIIVNRNMPYEYLFQTRINISKCTDLRNKQAAKKVIKSFEKLLRDDNNIDYFDQIYYEIAKVYQEIGDEQKAIEHFEYSSFFGKANAIQKTNTFLALGNLYFENKSYEKAGAYYDSCANVVPQTHPEHDEIKKQQEVLSELVQNLKTIRTQDSLLRVSKLDENALKTKIEEVKAYEKQQAEEEKIREERRKRREELASENEESSLDPGMMRGGGSKEWVLYNTRAIGIGHQQFIKKWGNRPLVDNWRRSASITNAINNPNNNEEDTGTVDSSTQLPDSFEEMSQEIPIDLESIEQENRRYYQDIPFLPAQKKSAHAKIIEALYGNGMLYYEKLGNYSRATESFNQLVADYPGNKFEVAAQYYLYKLAVQREDSVKAKEHKQLILTKYPNSEYAALLTGNGKFAEEQEVNPELERYYDEVYKAFQQKRCNFVQRKAAKADSLFMDNYLRPQFEYLSLLCDVNSMTRPEFKEALTNIITRFPGHNVAKDAKNVLEYYDRLDARRQQFVKDSTQHFQDSIKKYGSTEELKKTMEIPYTYTEDGSFIYIIVVDLDKVKPRELNTAFSNFNYKYHRSKNLSVNSYVLNDEQHVIAILGLKNLRTAIGYHKGFIDDEAFKQENNIEHAEGAFVSKDNFKLLIKAKSSVEYMQFFELEYSSLIEEM